MKNEITHVLLECPRERLMSKGAEALSNQELLSILLKTGTAKKHVSEVAESVVNTFVDLPELYRATIPELTEINGVGEVKAIELKAAFELGKRTALCPKQEENYVESSAAVAEMMISEMKYLDQEKLVVLLLDAKNKIIHKEVIFVGCVNKSLAHPREIFRVAVRYSAVSVIVVHNHPSGDTEPSSQDVFSTERLSQAGDIVGITLLDHIVVGNEQYFSFAEHKYIG